jgi:predicted metal-dependent hydrolase
MNTVPVVHPIRRNLAFDLTSNKLADWHPAGSHITTFINTLSIFFPLGERFFIESVRHYSASGSIKDPELLADVKQFIAQEAFHGREHVVYNEALADLGYNVKGMEQRIDTVLKAVSKLPPSMQISVTTALEHFTAVMAGVLLDTPEILEGADDDIAGLWRWHALEETEHKAVAFDVMHNALGNSPQVYAIRSATMILTTAIFWILVAEFYLRNLKSRKSLSKLGGWKAFARFGFGDIGVLRKLTKPYLDYFKPNFHPWHHDNRFHLDGIDEFSNRYLKNA